MLREDTPECVYCLADHMDTLLAAGEDLKALPPFQCVPVGACAAPQQSIQNYVHTIMSLEYAAIARLLRAREQASCLAQIDHRYSLLAELFVGATAIVADAVENLTDRVDREFVQGADPIVYLSSRGLISDDVGCLSFIRDIEIRDSFLLAGQIELGPLLDLCATFLDTLEEHFTLFPQIPEAPADHPAKAIRFNPFPQALHVPAGQ
ncbi:MAG: hypothetical protein ACR2PA_11150 [Hyphomicrobiaceae bacterium]